MGGSHLKQAHENILMHFRPDERPFVLRCLDWAERASNRNQMVLTPFLDPREQTILETIVRRHPDLVFFADGGAADSERRRAVIAPDYYAPDEHMSGLAFFRLESASGKRLEHPDVLGALLGLGIKREKTGDIYPHADGADIVVAEEMEEYVRMHVGQVGRERVNIIKISREELTPPEQAYAVRSISVASLRVDAVVAESCRISRTKASLLVKNGKCKVNWKLVDQPDYPVEAGDLLSVRGIGRIRVESIDGTSKKGRFWIKIVSFI
jgi:RNA-binding protein YlmH